MKKLHTASLTSLLLATVPTFSAFAADEAAAPAESKSFPELLTAYGITTSGYVAGSYYHSSGYSTYHQFDVEHDTFQLDQAAATIAYLPKEGFGAQVTVAAGEDIRIIHRAENGNDNLFDVIQGFVQYARGPFTVMAGKYVTLAGAEVIAPTGNLNFSRSLLFYGEPLTHTGIRASYAGIDTLTFTVGVNNGWNTTSTSYGSKTAEIGVGWTPIKALAVTAQAYIGKNEAFDANRTLIDVVATYTVTDALSVGASFDWGRQEQHVAGDPNLSWNGLALYGNYAWTEQWRTAVRVEYFDDKDGFNTGAVQKVKEVTFTAAYMPAKSFEARLEVRRDWSNESTFVKTLGTDADAPLLTKNQTGVALQGIFKF